MQVTAGRRYDARDRLTRPTALTVKSKWTEDLLDLLMGLAVFVTAGRLTNDGAACAR